MEEHNVGALFPELNLEFKPQLYYDLDALIDQYADETGMGGFKEKNDNFTIDISVSGDHH